MAIDYSKNFSKRVPSIVKAVSIVRGLLSDGEGYVDQTRSIIKKRCLSAYGTQRLFKWHYDNEDKILHVTYTDGRPEPIEKIKPEYFVVWIEGVEPKRGEKLSYLDRNRHEYTTKMSKAMRIKAEDINKVKELLKIQGVAKWAIEGDKTFHKVNYAPHGTLFKFS